jgi:acyl-homoserine-lactone acylase
MNDSLKGALLIGVAALTSLVAACHDDDDDEPTYSAEIRRTSFGIPHIKADDETGLGYGVGYAYAEDNFCLLADAFVTVNGERSRYFGPDALTHDVQVLQLVNETADFYYKLMNDRDTVQSAWRQQPAEVQALLKGYAAGYNRYLKDARTAALPAACKDEPWVRPITEQDLIKLMRMYAMNDTMNLIGGIVAAAPPGAARLARNGHASPPRFGHERIHTGSNAVALGKGATENGRGLLLGNPHFPWDGILRMYQLHLTIPGKLDVMGASLPGLPVVGIGFTRNFAWSHTTTRSSHYTLYALELDPTDPTRYRVDGQLKNMTKQTVVVEVKESDGAVRPRSRDFYRSEFGPLLVIPDPQLNLTWTTSTAYTLRDANAENHRLYEQWYEMNRASTLNELKAANERIVGNPWNNTLAADKDGNTLFQSITPVPNMPADRLATCVGEQYLPQLQYGFVVLNAGAACNWIVDPAAPQPGIVPGSQLPSLTQMSYVQNSNDSAWLTNPSAPVTGFSPLVSAEGYEQSARTRIGISQIEARLAGSDGLAGNRFTLQQLQQITLSNRVYYAQLLMDDVLTLCTGGMSATADDGSPIDLTDACSKLASWDRTANLDVGVAYAYFTGLVDQLPRIPNVWRVPFDPADPVNTPRGLNLADPSVVTALRQALASSVRDAASKGWGPTTRWGDLQIADRDGKNIPIHGGSDAYGVYNLMESRNAGDGLYRVFWGTSYMQAVTFDDQGPRAEALLTYSQSTDPRSPHYADQTERFSRKEWVRQPFSEAEIKADPQYRSKWIAE